MKITESNNHLILTLTDHDWKYFKPGCLAFIDAFKAEIQSPEREYNPLSKEWVVIGLHHRETIERLRDQHLVDRNQSLLFE